MRCEGHDDVMSRSYCRTETTRMTALAHFGAQVNVTSCHPTPLHRPGGRGNVKRRACKCGFVQTVAASPDCPTRFCKAFDASQSSIVDGCSSTCIIVALALATLRRLSCSSEVANNSDAFRAIAVRVFAGCPQTCDGKSDESTTATFSVPCTRRVRASAHPACTP